MKLPIPRLIGDRYKIKANPGLGPTEFVVVSCKQFGLKWLPTTDIYKFYQ